MRNAIMILGTILIAAVIIISGSAVAATYATSVYSETDCENSSNALYASDGEWATVGTNDPDPTAGDLILDFGIIGIPDNTWVVVYGQGSTGNDEHYKVRFWTTDFSEDSGWSGSSSDQTNNSFYTSSPSPGKSWEFIQINGLDGDTDLGDPIYGPEIDAVGY